MFSISFHSIIWRNYSDNLPIRIFIRRRKMHCVRDPKSSVENKSVLNMRKTSYCFTLLKIIWEWNDKNMATNSTLNLATNFLSWQSRHKKSRSAILYDSDKLQVQVVFPCFGKRVGSRWCQLVIREINKVAGRETTVPCPTNLLSENYVYVAISADKQCISTCELGNDLISTSLNGHIML